jgi:predicted CxxxxCH...CXXCH cytochrome family protein
MRVGRGVVCAMLLLAGCGTARPPDGRSRCLTWKEDVAPALAGCGDCHASFSYLDLVGGATPRALAGDPRSPLLLTLADDAHAGVAAVLPTVTEWVVTCGVAYERSAVHGPGLMNPRADDFHGADVKRRGWDFGVCATCHGADLSGGASGASCLTCHGGPSGCTSCHGQPPATGAHPAHAQSPMLRKPTGCDTCHAVPASWRDPGHLDGALQVKIAGWDSSTGRCSDVACHSGVATPSWRDGTLGCGGCHTLPPADHPESYCVGCHPKVVDGTGQIIDYTRHLDGQVSVGDESGSACGACHPTLPGAHAAHLAAPHKISKPLTCAACHVVPPTVLSPGHGNGVADVTAGWDPVARACTNECHGPTVSWAGPPVACGSCHKIPPADATHAGATLATCHTCHPSTVDANGLLLPDAHVNGVVDAQ